MTLAPFVSVDYTPSMYRIGVVGFSRSQFDHAAARTELAAALDALRTPGASVVSGLTNQGVPRIAYELATERSLRTVGFSARQALRVRAGRWPVDEQILVGARFGDESTAFVAYIDALIRIGGGAQSRHEADLFRERVAREGLDPARLIEREVTWFGRGRRASLTSD
jgi:hypothetical protein